MTNRTNLSTWQKVKRVQHFPRKLLQKFSSQDTFYAHDKLYFKTSVESIADQPHIYLELPRSAHTCPARSATTDRIHDYQMQTFLWPEIPFCIFVSALSLFLWQTILREKHIPRYYRVSSRLVAGVMFAFERLIPAAEIGNRFNVSAVTAMRYFNMFNKKLTAPPEVISLDEVKGNSGGQKYNSIIANPKEGTILDILPNRYENDLIRYFSHFCNNTNVKYFVCDMNPHFRKVAQICFPEVVIVADRYHVVR